MSRRRSPGRCALALCAAACVSLGVHCADAPSDPATAGDGVLLSRATWSLEWDTAGTHAEPGGGWSVTNDVGVTFVVESGWLVARSVAFGPCDLPDAGATGWLRLGPRAARAHGEDDPSTLTLALIEDLARPVASSGHAALFAPTRYCRAHWLVARATDSATSHLRGEAVGSSLALLGSWSRAGRGGRLSLRTWWTHGHLARIADVVDGGLPQHDAPLGADVVITRRLGALFDGVDPEALSEDELSWRVLDNLARGAVVRARLSVPKGARSG